MSVKRSPERAPDDEEDDVVLTEEEQDEITRRAAAAGDEGQDAPDNQDGAPGSDDELPEGEETAEEITERRARAMGWVPIEEWRGDRRKWRPAQEFLERATANGPVMNERLDKMSRELTESRTKLAEVEHRLAESTEVLAEMNQRQRTAWERGYKKAREELLARRDKAVEDADTEGFRAAEKELADLDEQHKGEPAQPRKTEPADEDRGKDPARQPPRVPPEMVEWKRQNTWFDSDDELASVAMAVERRIMADEPDLTLAERLQKVSREIRRRYPEKFENQRRAAPSAVNGGNNSRDGRSGRKGRTVADLPAEARDQLAKLKRTIPNYTDAEYLRDYEWD